MNDDYIPSNPWVTTGICFLIASISSVFAVTNKRKRSLRETSIDAIQSGLVGSTIFLALCEYVPYNIILVLCGVLGLSGPSFTMLIVTTGQEAILARYNAFLEVISGKKKDSKDGKNNNE